MKNKIQKMTKLAIFASGNGSNAEQIIKKFDYTPLIIKSIFTNNPDAFVIKRALKYNIPSYVFNKNELNTEVLEKLKELRIDFIILAGFLLLMPQNIIQEYQNRILNIHPALLPKYGGKGMYGNKVHDLIKKSGDKETGITIHLVNEKYDDGKILFQTKCDISETDSIDDIAKKVHELEYKYYPKIIREYIQK